MRLRITDLLMKQKINKRFSWMRQKVKTDIDFRIKEIKLFVNFDEYEVFEWIERDGKLT